MNKKLNHIINIGENCFNIPWIADILKWIFPGLSYKIVENIIKTSGMILKLDNRNLNNKSSKLYECENYKIDNKLYNDINNSNDNKKSELKGQKKILKKQISKHPNDIELYLDLGNIYIEESKLYNKDKSKSIKYSKDAIECYTEALKIKKNDLKILTVLSYINLYLYECTNDLNYIKESIKNLKKIKLEERDFDILLNLGNLYMILAEHEEEKSNIEKAINYYNKAEHINSKDIRVYINRMIGYRYLYLISGAKEKYEYYLKQLDDISKAKNIDDKNYTIYYNQGMMFYHMAKFFRDLDYSELTQINYNLNQDFGLNLEDYDNSKMGYELAKKSFEQSINLNPKYSKSYIAMGCLYKELGKIEYSIWEKIEKAKNVKQCKIYFNKSIQCYCKAMDIEENKITLYNEIATPYYYLDKYKESLAYMYKALDNYNNEIYNNLDLDYVYILLRNMNNLNHYDKSYVTNSLLGMLHLRTGCILNKIPNGSAEAEGHFNKAKKYEITSVYANFELANIYADILKHEKAINLYTTVIKNTNNLANRTIQMMAYNNRANSYKAIGEYMNYKKDKIEYNRLNNLEDKSSYDNHIKIISI